MTENQSISANNQYDIPADFSWETPELTEFRPALRYHGLSSCTALGDDCEPGIGDDNLG